MVEWSSKGRLPPGPTARSHTPPACAIQSTTEWPREKGGHRDNGRVHPGHASVQRWPDGVLVGRGSEVHCWVKKGLHTRPGRPDSPRGVEADKADLSMARVWGCVGCILLPSLRRRPKGKASGTRGLIGVSWGWTQSPKPGACWIQTPVKVRVTRNVRFLEHLTRGDGGRWGEQEQDSKQEGRLRCWSSSQHLLPEPKQEEAEEGSEDFREPLAKRPGKARKTGTRTPYDKGLQARSSGESS